MILTSLRKLKNPPKFIAKALTVVAGAIIATCFLAYPMIRHLDAAYAFLASKTITDRNGKILKIEPNIHGYYNIPASSVPQTFERLLLLKEDRFFYYHPGVNALRLFGNKGSTITEQLVKVLLGNEKERTYKNKIIEVFYALSLELYKSKTQILEMYTNTAYFGNLAQGLKEASRLYFDKDPDSLNEEEILRILATLSSPSVQRPGTEENTKTALKLAKAFDISIDEEKFKAENKFFYPRPNINYFELDSLGVNCEKSCELTIDADLTEKIRSSLDKNLKLPSFSDATSGAVVAIKLPENELIAMVGSPDPASGAPGRQINMAVKPRPIGSTSKPFIYMKAFEKGARPYSTVEDAEIAYVIGTGSPFYPRNYDGKYRGTVTLHEALSNSLNIPSVKVLEYVGLPTIYSFFEETMGFVPIQPMEIYGIGIALGSLEMNLLTLSHYFTIFPNEGVLKPLKASSALSQIKPLMEAPIKAEKTVANPDLIRLINKVLSDRETSVDQFGLKSNLNIASKNYALKTGTSRDFHDSWTIGYTPDFLVGVWVGNSDNTPMRQVTGQSGAGKIWHETMELLANTSYNKNNQFNFSTIKEFNSNDTIEYGLKDDDYAKSKIALQNESLILHPHDGDLLLFEPSNIVPLRSRVSSKWFVNGILVGVGKEISWQPKKSGSYTITAESSAGKEKETIKISVTAEK